MQGNRTDARTAYTAAQSWKGVIEAAADLTECMAGQFFEPRRSRQHSATTASATRIAHLLQSGADALGPGVTRSELQHLLRASSIWASVRLRDSMQLPQWASDLKELLPYLVSPPAGAESFADSIRKHPDSVFFLPLCRPILQLAIKWLKAECPPRLLEQLSSAAVRKLHAGLACTLIQAVTPAAAMHFSSRTERVRGCSAFAFPPPVGSGLIGLFQEFPALARLMVSIARDWERSTLEFLQRLDRDYTKLKRLAGKSKTRRWKRRGLVVDIDPNLSDPHNRGRTVMAVHFSRVSFIYKPRSCQGEKEWGRLIRLIRNRQLRPDCPEVIECKTYGWMEFVRSKRCRSAAESRLFYRRAGALLLLAHLCGAVDLHRGNVIAAGASPVIVDAEALAHPSFSPSGVTASKRNGDLARTGLLPGSIPAYALDSGTEPSPDQHRPTLRAEPLRASDFADEIEKGFRSVAQEMFATVQSRERCARICSRVARGQWRRILRPTSAYAAVRRWSVQPSLLRNGVKRHVAILQRCAEGGVPLPIASVEAAALARFDIPLFIGTTIRFGDHRKSRLLPALNELLAAAPQIADCWA